MHEYSVVQALIDQCEAEARKAGASEVLKITVKVGKLSGIEPQLLASAFEFFGAESFCKGAELELISQGVVVKCPDCGAQTELAELNFCCPHCASENISVIDGEELILMSLEMR